MSDLSDCYPVVPSGHVDIDGEGAAMTEQPVEPVHDATSVSRPAHALESEKDSLSKWSSESAIYGLIVVSALIIVTDTTYASSGSVLTKVFGTVFVFWIAHAFAEVLARLGQTPTGEFRFWAEVRRALLHAIGLPVAAILPLCILLFGALTPVNDEAAIWAVLWVDLLLLATFGYLAARSRTEHVWQRLGVAGLTAILGAVLMLLKALIH